MQALELLIPVAVAFGVAFASTPVVVRLAAALGIVDRPSERGVSRRTNMPLMGGLAVALGFAAGLSVALGLARVPARGHLEGLAIGGALLLGAGIWDDRFGMHARAKFALQIAAAAVAITYGFQLSHITEPISRTVFLLPPWLMWLATTLWIVGVTNAVNLVDGLDGLATGVSAIIGATLTYIAWHADQTFAVCIGVALVGGSLGFLPFNFSPARIFLGDTGSLFIGYVLALLSLEYYRQASLLTFVVPLLALGVPILDTAVSILRRVRLRTPIFRADRLHMHHRLLASEGSARNAVVQIYVLTASFCLLAVGFIKLRGYVAGIFLVAVAAVTVRLLWNLGVLSREAEDADPGALPGAAEEKER